MPRRRLIFLLLLVDLIIAQNTLSVNGTVYSFASKAKISDSYTLFWNTTKANVTFGVSASVVAYGWAALGFNQDGVMFPSRAIIARRVSNVANVTELSISAADPTGIIPASVPVMSNAKLSYNSDGTTLSFVFSIAATAEPVIKLDGSTSSLIYALGPEQTTPYIPQHTENGGYKVNLLHIGNASPVKMLFFDSLNAYVDEFRGQFIGLHACFMMIAWMVLAPLGSLAASPQFRKRLFPDDKKSNPRHTKVHVMTLTAVIVLALLGFMIGFFFIGSGTFMTHTALGIIVLILMFIQVFLGTARRTAVPGKAKGTLSRIAKKYKNTLVTLHAWNGRLTWNIAACNVFYGLTIYPYLGAIATAAAMFMTVVGIALIMSGPAYGYFKSRAQTEGKSQAKEDASKDDTIAKPEKSYLDLK